MKDSTEHNNKIPIPPDNFEEDEKLMWNYSPLWRESFLKNHSQIKKTFLLKFLKLNFLPIISSVLIAILLNYFTEISISIESLLLLSIGLLTATGAIMTIIFTFVTFWFSNADNAMHKAQDVIKSQIAELNTTKENIYHYTMGPKESVQGHMKEKAEILADASKKFLDAINALIGRFSRASFGTFYDGISLYELDAVINQTGGKWFVSYCKLITNPPDQDNAKSIWLSTMSISRRIGEQNGEIRTSINQISRILNFTPTLASLLFIFIFSLIVTLISSTSAQYTLLPLLRLMFSAILITLLVTHLTNIFRVLWLYISSKHVLHKINRVSDLNQTKKMEETLQLDYKSAVKHQADIIIKSLEKTHPPTTSSSDSDTSEQPL